MGNFILANVRSFALINGEEVPNSGAQLANHLLNYGVITRPVDNYNLSDWLRVSVGTELENKRIVDALHKLKSAYLDFERILILGCGLIGSSLAAKARECGLAKEIVGVDNK